MVRHHGLDGVQQAACGAERGVKCYDVKIQVQAHVLGDVRLFLSVYTHRYSCNGCDISSDNLSAYLMFGSPYFCGPGLGRSPVSCKSPPSPDTRPHATSPLTELSACGVCWMQSATRLALKSQCGAISRPDNSSALAVSVCRESDVRACVRETRELLSFPS
ncbi:hypothetical protein J6590_008798 [Homalodisca vitripennis]|nr:hypothetical protein J6590_008798 [Homalodisca vitripennis]